MSLPRALISISAAACLASSAAAQAAPSDTALPRRIQLGATLADVADSAAARGLPRGARVLGIVPGSAAQAAGLLVDDVIIRIANDSVSSVADALGALRPLRSGIATRLVAVRNGARRELTFVGRERPRETSTEFDIVYTAVDAPGGRRRVLVAHPKDRARHPAVLLVGGIGCYSVDQATGVNSYRDLMDDLTRHGYTTFRVEKAGVGDSEGGPCLETDFDTELAGYRAALGEMSRSPFVDPARIVLLGHSIGGIEAPLLAASPTPRVRAVAAISTVGINWYEYELANLRRQLNLEHLAPDSIEIDMAQKITCGFHFLVERETRRELLARQPDCAASIGYPASDAYMQRVASHAPAIVWRNVTVPVLLLYGSADFITSRAEHLWLASALNQMHPGQATFAEVPELDHYLSREASQQASYDDRTPGLSRPFYGAALEPILLAWLDRVTSTG